VEVAGLGRDERWPAYRNVCRQLALAESYRTQRATLVTWWRGTRVQGTWAHIQNAKVGLIDVLDTDQVVGYSARVRSLVERYLEEGDPERIAVNALFERLDRHSSQVIALTGSVDRLSMVRGKLTFTGSLESSEAKEPARPDIGLRDRAALAAALQAAYERTAAEYQRLRRFESLVIGSAVAVLVLVGILALVGWREPSVVPLCFPDPGEQVAEPEGQSDRRGTVCATQDAPPPVASDTSANGTQSEQQPEPSAGDVPTVALFGLIGASLTSVSFVVRKAPRTSVPIGTSRIFQVVLKAATGMLTAVVGLLFLRAGVVPGFTRIDTRSQILVYAVIFGAAQHLVTTFIDRRSNELVEAVTSIETEETPRVSASPPGR
jgi:hypothetical protein